MTTDKSVVSKVPAVWRADVQHVTWQGMAALATAILRGETSTQHLDDILSRGIDVADLNFRDPLGRSLIHLAADSNDVSALRWLVQEHGANPRTATAKEGRYLGRSIVDGKSEC